MGGERRGREGRRRGGKGWGEAIRKELKRGLRRSVVEKMGVKGMW
jgi:hypothetical protein